MHVYCVFDALSRNSPLRWWVTWKCMFIVCLTILFSIMSSLQEVSYVKVHVYCVFDYFLLNLVSISDGELCESACLLCVWLLSSQSCLHFIQRVSYVKVHVYCVFDYFFSILSPLNSARELRESACLLCVWLFSSQSCLHSDGELRESACLLCVWLLSSQSCLHFIQRVSYVKVHVYCVFDYFLLNFVST